jgi:hypothetical protein
MTHNRIADNQEAKSARRDEFRRRLLATGLTITKFQRLSGLTRNVVYNLSSGQAPSSEAQRQMLEHAFTSLRSSRELAASGRERDSEIDSDA